MNTPSNQKYVGPYPPPSMYGIDAMSTKDREDFFQWYATMTSEFDFRKEMQAYCVSDVDILRRASLKFRHLLLSTTGEEIPEKDHFENGVDPFSFTTIASVCMGVFRYLHLDKVGVLRPIQQPGSYWDRSSELPLVGLEPTEVTAYD